MEIEAKLGDERMHASCDRDYNNYATAFEWFVGCARICSYETFYQFHVAHVHIYCMHLLNEYLIYHVATGTAKI